MASAQLSKLCVCIVTLLTLAGHTMASQAQPQPSFATDTMPTDDELISLAASSPSPSTYLENPAPESGDYLASSSDSYTPPPPPPQPYIEAFAPESEDNQLLSPDYSPSPAPYFQEYLGSDPITDYPSPPPYIEVEAPESYYEPYTPTQAPSPAPATELESSSQFVDADDGSTYSPSLAPQPNVLPFNYEAEDDSAQEFELESDDAYSDESKNKKTMVGFMLGAVCLVGLAGLVFNKKKYIKSKSEHEYELAKREDL